MTKLTITLLLIISFAYGNNTYASEVGRTWEIKGQLIEEATGETIPYATVALYAKKDSSLITGSTSNFDGEFSLEKVAKGDYYLKLSFIGFKDLIINTLNFTNASSSIELGTIELQSDVTVLDEFEVTAKVAAVSNNIDKQVINVEQNISVKGGTASDALRLSPSIQVDNEGNVKLRGSTEFIVLINGKPTALSSEEVLQQTPANMISKIEVITNPSVKYSSEGGAGIINIILKKNAAKGMNGMANVMAGTKDKYSGDLSFNLNSEKISFSAGFEGRSYTSTAINNYYRDLYYTNDVHHAFMGQDRTMTESNIGTRFCFDYNPNERNNFNFSIHSGFITTELNINTNTAGYLDSDSDRTNENMYNSVYMNMTPTFYTNNLGYNLKLDSNGSNLNVNVFYSHIDYSLFTSQEFYHADNNFNPNDSQPYLQDITNNNNSDESKVDVDYTKVFNEKTSLEVGLSANNYFRFLDITFAEYDYSENDWVNHPDYSNKYDFNEAIYGGYTNLNTSFWGINASLGLRLEYTDRILQQRSSQQNYKYNKMNFFPGFSFSKSINDKNSLKLAMTNRINRPDEYMMNPFPEFEDNYFLSTGNPYLIPEIVRNLEAAYNYSGKKTSLSANLYYRTTSDKLDQRLTINDEDKIHVTFHNNSSDAATGLELMGNFDLTKWWSLNANTNTYYYETEGNVDGELFFRSNFAWSAQLVNTFSIKDNTSIQLISYYNSKTVRTQGELRDYYFVDLAVNHAFLDGKLNVNLQLKDIFQTLNYQLYTETGNMQLLGDFQNESPIFLVSVGYQINKYQKKTKDVHTDLVVVVSSISSSSS